MATAGSWRIYGTVTGLPSGSRSVDASIAAPTTAIDATTTLACTTGFNAVTVPTGYTAVLVIPPSANAQTIQLKGVTGDTGVPLSKTLPSAIALGATAAFGFTVGGSVTLTLVWM